MCGLAAIVASGDHRIAPALMQSMNRCLAHRGPDGSGIATFNRQGQPVEAEAAHVALLHRRLAIIDLDRRAAQPMASADGRYVLILNGEIYNYVELRETLRRAGHQFRTSSDTEVLVAAFAEWREAALNRLIGMFAFIVLDRTRRELFIARDPFGIKPIYWAHARGLFAFASEIPPLLELPGLRRAANLARVGLFLASGQTDHGESTMFAGINSIPAASFATISLDQPQPPVAKKYWQPTIAPAAHNPVDTAQTLREMLLESVSMHLRSDVPVGCALSGGIDSSAIVACMRQVGGEALRIKTFSFAAAGSDLDESEYMRMAATAANTESHTVRVEPDEIAADIDQLIAIQGEPFGSLSIYAQYRVMQLAAANGIKVILDGQGADELFAGYRPYIARRLSEMMLRFDARGIVQMLGALRSLPDASYLLLAQAFEPGVPPRWRALARKLIGKPTLPPWIDESWFVRRKVLIGSAAAPRSRRILHDALVESLTETVLPALLRFEDRNSMAFSIESRVPFLTTEMADFAYSLPPEQLVDNHAIGKKVLRAAMRGIVPDAILDRRDKIGFATPDDLWARSLQPWFLEVLASDAARGLPWLDAGHARRTLDERVKRSAPFGADLWRTVILIRWLEHFGIEIE